MDELVVTENHTTYRSFLELCENVNDYIEDQEPKFRFFPCLPLELRELVYSFYLTKFFRKNTHAVFQRTRLRGLPDQPKFSPDMPLIRPAYQVLLPNVCNVSKQIRFEASRAVIRSVVWDINMDPRLISLKEVLTAWRGPERLSNVRSVRFSTLMLN